MKYAANKRLIYRIYKELLPINLNKGKKNNRKICKRHKQPFTEKKIPKAYRIQRNVQPHEYLEKYISRLERDSFILIHLVGSKLKGLKM